MPTDRYIASNLAMIGDFMPQAPEDWPPERRARFERIAGALPRGWWDGSNEPLLREYCCAIEASERLGAIIDGLDVMTCDARELSRVLAARDREAKRVLSLARLQRLTPLALPPRAEGRDVPSDPANAPWADA
jgi:hypothetical protein